MIIGQTVRDLVSGNWCSIVEIDATAGKVRLKNPYVEIGWRLISEICEYEPGTNRTALKPTQPPADVHEPIADDRTGGTIGMIATNQPMNGDVTTFSYPEEPKPMKIFRVTSSIDPKGRLVKAPTAKIAEKYVIGLMGVKATLATQDELIQAGQNGERAELAAAPMARAEVPDAPGPKGGAK